MGTVRVELDIPDVVVESYGGIDPLREALSQSAVLELVRRGEIDPSRGAELLGVPLSDFIRLMDSHGIPYFNYTPDEWEEELAAVNAARQRAGGAGG